MTEPLHGITRAAQAQHEQLATSWWPSG